MFKLILEKEEEPEIKLLISIGSWKKQESFRKTSIPQTEEPGRPQSMGIQSWTRLSDFNFTCHSYLLEKEMATHSSVLAWRIPGMGEPGGLLSMRLQSRT